MIKNRIGRFTIDERLIRSIAAGERPEDAAQWCSIFGQVVVIDVENKWDALSRTYLCYSEKFDPVEEGIEAPHYNVIIEKRDGFDGHMRVVTFDAIFQRT